MASPLGSSHGASELRRATVSVAASIVTNSLLSSMLTKMRPPSVTEFRLPAEGDGGNHFAIGVEYGRVLSTPIEREDMLRAGVVENRIGVIAGRLHFCDGRELVQVEYGHRSAAAVADEAATEVGSQRDSVHALGLGNCSDDLASLDIDYFDAIAVRHEQPARCAVDA